MLDGDVVVGRVLIRILRHPAAIAAHVSATQVQNAHFESFDTPNLAFDIGSSGHVFIKSSPADFLVQC